MRETLHGSISRTIMGDAPSRNKEDEIIYEFKNFPAGLMNNCNTSHT
jgi:hypothetical protein